MSKETKLVYYVSYTIHGHNGRILGNGCGEFTTNKAPTTVDEVKTMFGEPAKFCFLESLGEGSDSLRPAQVRDALICGFSLLREIEVQQIEKKD